MKGFRQFCAASRALDVLGDRWTLLVVRELLFGPRRYTDLLAGLPGIGSSVLTTRLRNLEHANLVARRRLPPPTPAIVYELTDNGEDLRSVMDALTRWGLRLMDSPRPDDTIRASWLTLSLCVSVPPTFLPTGSELELRLDGEPHTVRERDGRLEARSGHAARPISIIQSSIEAMYLIVSGQNDRAELQARDAFVIVGDHQVGEAFLDAAHAAWRSPAPPRS